MIYAFDALYKGDTGKIVCLGFNSWEDSSFKMQIIKNISPVAEYEPGSFYKRELPCILEVIKDICLEQEDILIIDGYVFLDNNRKPGLGFYLYEQFSGKYPVIGVAKSRFFENTELVKEVFRGESRNPLFVTATGMDPAHAASCIKKMHGEFRIPTLLQLLDSKTREA
jgi:deoxyribonuclease V